MLPTLPTGRRGLVRPWERDRSFSLERRAPAPAIARLVERHWIVRWDLRGRPPFRQETLPYPSVNLVAEPGGARVWGVPRERDVRVLSGRGWAVGTKFRPGAFTACTGIEAARVTDRHLAPEAAFGTAAGALAGAGEEPDAVIGAVEALLAPLAGVEDPSFELVTAVVASMAHVGPDARVAELAAMHHVAPRTLQKAFRRSVGVSPKWVLKRLRVQEAAARLARPGAGDWSRLALELGYYDHAHFIRDFRRVVGRTPAAYAAEAARGREAA